MSWQLAAFDEGDVQGLKSNNECQRCGLIKADLEGVNLAGSNMTAVSLAGANLQRAILSDTHITFGKLIDENLNGANL